jgi:hypothetical protein
MPGTNGSGGTSLVSAFDHQQVGEIDAARSHVDQQLALCRLRGGDLFKYETGRPGKIPADYSAHSRSLLHCGVLRFCRTRSLDFVIIAV